MELVSDILLESWRLLRESSVYILFGIFVAGIIKIFLSPETVTRHLGKGRFASVFKAAFFGIPIPLCSCGVLPAAASIRKQGANRGATAAFLISTPESGVDSIALTYALLDPVMTVARPVAAFATATAAGLVENSFQGEESNENIIPAKSCRVDGCCDGVDCPPEEHNNHHSFKEKLQAGLTYAFGELWGDIAVWLLMGLILAGLISTLIPSEFLSTHLGGGLKSMVIMLAAGIPLYICATASTPIAAALILNGVSPGAALVFLLTGPATNITSLTVLLKILGKRSTALYLLSIVVFSVIFGLVVDKVYSVFNISAQATVGHSDEVIPVWTQILGALTLLALSLKPVYRSFISRLDKIRGRDSIQHCGCTDGSAFSHSETQKQTCDCQATS